MIGEMFDLLECIGSVLIGWAYVFSPKFRKDIHSKWAHDSRRTILWEIVYGVFGIVLSLGLLGLLGWFVFWKIRS